MTPVFHLGQMRPVNSFWKHIKIDLLKSNCRSVRRGLGKTSNPPQSRLDTDGPSSQPVGACRWEKKKRNMLSLCDSWQTTNVWVYANLPLFRQKHRQTQELRKLFCRQRAFIWHLRKQNIGWENEWGKQFVVIFLHMCFTWCQSLHCPERRLSFLLHCETVAGQPSHHCQTHAAYREDRCGKEREGQSQRDYFKSEILSYSVEICIRISNHWGDMRIRVLRKQNTVSFQTPGSDRKWQSEGLD